jgi:hypothetical protein
MLQPPYSNSTDLKKNLKSHTGEHLGKQIIRQVETSIENGYSKYLGLQLS